MLRSWALIQCSKPMTIRDARLLDLYSDYLIASFGQATATGLSRLVADLSHDQVTRFLNGHELAVVCSPKTVPPAALVSSFDKGDKVPLEERIRDESRTDDRRANRRYFTRGREGRQNPRRTVPGKRYQPEHFLHGHRYVTALAKEIWHHADK